MKINLLTMGTVTVLALMLVAVSGCPKTPPPPPKPKAECQKSADCPEGKVCKSGKCVKEEVEKPKPECTASEDCPEPKICKNEKCVFECVSGADCGSGLACENNHCIEMVAKCEIGPVYFDFDQYFLTSEAQETLRGGGKCLLKQMPKKIKIEGYCDERGTVEYNMALGDKRAKAVKTFLVDLGLPKNIIQTISYGEEYAGRCEDEGCWSKDRKGVSTIDAQ